MPPFAWSPSGDRTILLSDQAMAAPTGRLAAVLPLRWPDTPAGAQLDVSLDASALQASAADALTVVLNATTNVTAIAAPVIIGGLVVLWIASGGAGTDGLVDLTLTTVSGTVARRIVRLLIT